MRTRMSFAEELQDYYNAQHKSGRGGWWVSFFSYEEKDKEINKLVSQNKILK